MENHAENHNHEHRTGVSSEVLVPGLDAAAEDLRTAYPDMSEESIARILGLPTRKGVLSHSVVPDCQEGEDNQ